MISMNLSTENDDGQWRMRNEMSGRMEMSTYHCDRDPRIQLRIAGAAAVKLCLQNIINKVLQCLSSEITAQLPS